MSQTKLTQSRLSAFYTLFKQALHGGEHDFTTGSIRRSVILLAIPMMLEMCMESVFALVDLYFVGHLKHSSYAIQTVGLTESVLMVIYSLAIGLSMAATAVVARRIGEKDPAAAAKAGMQVILIAVFINIIISVFGVMYAPKLLSLMGSSPAATAEGANFTRLMMGSSLFIMLLFLINGIFRGAGNAAIAMRSLWVANATNIVLCPILINGLGPIPAFGLTGAAMATTIGRGTGVCYQLYHLFGGKGALKILPAYFKPHFQQMAALIKIAAPGVFQFLIASCSWIALAKMVADTGGDHGSAGYQTSLRLMMFFMLPAWGMSNAAATLVGQNLGAKLIERAEDSVYKTAKYNVIYMACVTLLSFTSAKLMVGFFTNDPQVQVVAIRAVHIMCIGYIIYGVGMVLMNAFNGAGDTWTPTWVNVFGFWFVQIPLSWFLSEYLTMGPQGVFIAIVLSEAVITITGVILFRRGRWKRIKV